MHLPAMKLGDEASSQEISKIKYGLGGKMKLKSYLDYLEEMKDLKNYQTEML